MRGGGGYCSLYGTSGGGIDVQRSCTRVETPAQPLRAQQPHMDDAWDVLVQCSTLEMVSFWAEYGTPHFWRHRSWNFRRRQQHAAWFGKIQVLLTVNYEVASIQRRSIAATRSDRFQQVESSMYLVGSGDQEPADLHLLHVVETQDADVAAWEGLLALLNLHQDLRGILASEHGQLPHGPVTTIVVAWAGVILTRDSVGILLSYQTTRQKMVAKFHSLSPMQCGLYFSFKLQIVFIN